MNKDLTILVHSIVILMFYINGWVIVSFYFQDFGISS